LKFIKKLWRGDISLTDTFWVMGVIVNVAISFFKTFLGWWLNLHEDVTDLKLTIILILTIVSLLYSVFISICIWRSATKYILTEDASEDEERDGTWGYWAKVIVAFNWAVFIVLLILAR